VTVTAATVMVQPRRRRRPGRAEDPRSRAAAAAAAQKQIAGDPARVPRGRHGRDSLSLAGDRGPMTVTQCCQLDSP
jgi:hypothetical protein